MSLVMGIMYDPRDYEIIRAHIVSHDMLGRTQNPQAGNTEFL